MIRSPLARGTSVAVAAAILFGATAPLVTRFGRNVGPFATATLLYAGAVVAAGRPLPSGAEPSVRQVHARRLLVVALLGALIAPTCLAWGLQRAGPLAASLLLNLEAIFTVALARIIYHEKLGRRVLVASTLMLLGGALVAARGMNAGMGGLLGFGALASATLAWALDNTFTRPLADLDPRAVVFWKGLLGAGMSCAAALVVGDRWPDVRCTVSLVACGAFGYGLSLRLYLGAQRILGAARTGSVFAVGPFVGAALAFGLGDRAGGVGVVAAAACFVAAVWLHATERHAHRHQHDALTHEHAHEHDDGHHLHAHDTPVTGSHSDVHGHRPIAHEHPHAPDLHHGHRHD